MALRATIAVLLTGALAAGACTTEQSTQPGSTLTTTSSTTVPPATSTPTTEAPVATDPPATDASTTTVAAPPVAKEIPLLIGSGTSGWLSLGTWQVDHWQGPVDDDGDDIAPSVGAGLAMTVSDLSGERVGTLGGTVEACYDDRDGPSLQPAVAPPTTPGFGYGAVALPTPTWTLKPRRLVTTTSGPDAYRTLAAGLLTGTGVDANNGSIVQLVIADLDGDGDDEAIAVYEFIQQPETPGTPGDFSMVFLVDTDSRKASAVLADTVRADFPADEFDVVNRYRVIDVADYNGDGTMEAVAHVWYYEGAGAILFGYDGTSLVELSANGCGA